MKTKTLAEKLGCSVPLAEDLLILAGGDEEIVLKASQETKLGVESFKNRIINERFKKIERK